MECRATLAQTKLEEARLETEAQESSAKMYTLQEANALLSNEVANKDGIIDRLQLRCASLVAEKTEKNRLLEVERAERTKQTKEIRVRHSSPLLYHKPTPVLVLTRLRTLLPRYLCLSACCMSLLPRHAGRI